MLKPVLDPVTIIKLDVDLPKLKELGLSQEFYSYLQEFSSHVYDMGMSINFLQNYMMLHVDSPMPDHLYLLSGGGAYLPTFQFTIPGYLMVGDNQPPATPVPYPVTAIQLYAYVKEVPYSSDVIIQVNNNGISIGTVTIAVGNNVGYTIISKSLSLNDILTIDINQCTEWDAIDLTIQVRT